MRVCARRSFECLLTGFGGRDRKVLPYINGQLSSLICLVERMEKSVSILRRDKKRFGARGLPLFLSQIGSLK
jgi:hypothetical protein